MLDPDTPRAPDDVAAGLSKLVVAGYILAVAVPIVGLGIGVTLLKRPQPGTTRHGLWMIAISIVVTFIFFLVLIVSGHSSGGEELG